MQYAANDGEKFEAANTDEVIAHFMTSAWFTEASTPEEFMKGMAARVSEQTGVDLDCSTSAAFVAGLINCGLIKEIGD